jgi:hypothetical protein
VNAYPEDWKYYTLNFPVARYKYLSLGQIIREMAACNATFYSTSNILSRLGRTVVAGRNPVYGFLSNVTSRRNSRRFAQIHVALWPVEAGATGERPLEAPGEDVVDVWEAAVLRLRQVASAFKTPAVWLYRQL